MKRIEKVLTITFEKINVIFVKMKMKQKIALVLAVFYMVSMSGFAFGLHYCGGKLASVSLFGSSPNCKMCSKMASIHQHNSCCKDAKIEVKVKDNHQVAAKLTVQKLFEVKLPARAFVFNTARSLPATAIAYNFNKAPPNTGQPSLNILNCTFRI